MNLKATVLFLTLLLMHNLLGRNTPEDSSEAPITIDEVIETLNQLAMYIARKDYKKNFWDTEPYLKQMLPKWKKWQKVWKNHILHYTPRITPQQEDVTVDGLIEKFDTKKAKSDSQIKSVKISPMFGPDVVNLYKKANEAYNPAAQIKSADDAENARALFALELRYMIGCDCEWTFPDDPSPSDTVVRNALPAAVLPAAGVSDDAPPPAPAAVDPLDFTRWDVLNMDTLPMAEQKFEADNIKSRRSAHAALILFFLSDKMEAAHPDVAAALHSGFQKVYERPVEMSDVRRYPTVGPNAYTDEEIKWCNATIDFLESELDDEGCAKRALAPQRRGRRGGAAAAASPAPPPPPPGRSTKAADKEPAIETEDDDDLPLIGRGGGRSKRKAR